MLTCQSRPIAAANKSLHPTAMTHKQLVAVRWRRVNSIRSRLRGDDAISSERHSPEAVSGLQGRRAGYEPAGHSATRNRLFIVRGLAQSCERAIGPGGSRRRFNPRLGFRGLQKPAKSCFLGRVGERRATTSASTWRGVHSVAVLLHRLPATVLALGGRRLGEASECGRAGSSSRSGACGRVSPPRTSRCTRPPQRLA
jgi:hypothetical protein